MSAIFLSASVPVEGRGNYHETADPFLIQIAVRELIMAVVPQHQVVWGGHPAITPMIKAVCQDLNISYDDHFILYQSRFFKDLFPQDNQVFEANLVLVDKVEGNRDASLQKLRKEMLSRTDLYAAVFIGGMDGVEVEYLIFHRYHPDAVVLPVFSTGGAAQELWKKIVAKDRDSNHTISIRDIDFAKLFRDGLTVQAE